MTLQGDVMVFNSPERNVILPGSSGLVCKLSPGAVLFCDFAVKDFDRQGRKVNAKDAKMVKHRGRPGVTGSHQSTGGTSLALLIIQHEQVSSHGD